MNEWVNLSNGGWGGRRVESIGKNGLQKLATVEKEIYWNLESEI